MSERDKLIEAEHLLAAARKQHERFIDKLAHSGAVDEETLSAARDALFRLRDAHDLYRSALREAKRLENGSR